MMREVRTGMTTYGWLALAPLAAAACGGGSMPEPEPEPAMESAPAAADPMPASTGPRVFFVAPEDGGTYPAGSPVTFEFGLENYELGAVPEAVDQPRAGLGHHHLGLNTDCLPPGEVIPQGEPEWIHFGDATATIDMMLEPGEHSFVLQLGDDEHRTQTDEGLCASVTIRVEEGA